MFSAEDLVVIFTAACSQYFRTRFSCWCIHFCLMSAIENQPVPVLRKGRSAKCGLLLLVLFHHDCVRA